MAIMTAYTTIPGDTFELIARKQYGTEQEALRIQQANPGLVEPFIVGTELYVPAIPDAPVDKIQQAPATGLNEVALLIDGVRFRFWQQVQITQSIDGMSTVDFSAPFEPDAPGFKEAFRPFSFKPIEITVGGDPLFTGTMVTPLPVQTPNERTIQVSGYSLPGVLNDCTFPASAFPTEFNGQTLEEIATTAAGMFGLSVVFEADAGPPFERVRCEPGKKVLAFLSELAKQRNLIISSNAAGALLFLQSAATGQAIGQLQQGQSPLISVTPTFNAQEYYTHITGVTATIVGIEGPQHTVKNPHPTDGVRPFIFSADDINPAEIEAAVNAKTGRMFGAIATYQVEVATWRDMNGALWAPNTTLKLQAPGAMIYEPYEFLVKSVTFRKERASETASLSLVLPGAYSGEIPEGLPWG